MRFLFLLIFLLAQSSSFAQVKGKVVSSESKLALKSVSIFINGSTGRTISNDKGEFSLPINSLLNSYELIFSCIGYETYSKTIRQNELNNFITIELKPRFANLDEVEVKSDFETVSWEKWGRYFTENFIGMNNNSKDCIINNPEVIKLKFSRKKNILRASSDSLISITNNALGYNISYKLEKFESNFKSNIIYHEGYSFFEIIETSRKRKQTYWQNARRKAFYGSINHFIRSVFNKKVEQEGFIVKKMIKYENYERKRVSEIIKNRSINKNNEEVKINFNQNNSDSAKYYQDVMRQPQILEKVYPQVLSAKDFSITNEAHQIVLKFKDYLQIEYANENEEEEFIKLNRLDREVGYQTSTINLLNDEGVVIFKNGQFIENKDLLMGIYWSYREKISNLLPIEFEP